MRITFLAVCVYYQVVNMTTKPRYEHCSLSKRNVAIEFMSHFQSFLVERKKIVTSIRITFVAIVSMLRVKPMTTTILSLSLTLRVCVCLVAPYALHSAYACEPNFVFI